MSDIYRFGAFELDTRTGELRASGVVLPLQRQPAAVLSLLVRRAGGLVTREEIQRTIWPDRTVDYEQGLNYAIRQIRSVTGDDADTPRFIETLPRRGYRFVAPVARIPSEPATGAPRRMTRAPALAALLLVRPRGAGGHWNSSPTARAAGCACSSSASPRRTGPGRAPLREITAQSDAAAHRLKLAVQTRQGGAWKIVYEFEPTAPIDRVYRVSFARPPMDHGS